MCVCGGGGGSVIGKRGRLMGRLNSGQYVHILSGGRAGGLWGGGGGAGD